MEATFEIKGHVYVLARLLEPDANFVVTARSTLGGCPVEEWLEMPRALDAQGRPRLDLFGFRLEAAGDRAHFAAGRRVTLEA